MRKTNGNTLAQRMIGREALLFWHRHQRQHAPRCGARSRQTGLPCKQIALANGRCHWHGGRTPKGDEWHKPRWPKPGTPNAERKLQRKLRDLERARRRREERLARMSDDERAAYERWHEARPLGSASRRLAERIRRQQATEARRAVQSLQEAPRPPHPEVERLDRLIERLEADLAALRANKPFDIFD